MKPFRFILLLFTSFQFGALWLSGQELKVNEKVDVLSTLAREPMLAEHPNGDLYVAGYRNAGITPQLWKSTDKGTSWNPVDVGTLEEGADGNSDVDLVIDEDGVIYFITMKYTRIPKDTAGFDWKMKGEHIAVGVSSDEGSSWDWQYLSQQAYDDRPWIVIGSNGAAHVIWNDGKGVHYTFSDDKGKTWKRRDDLYAKGGSSHFAAGPDGRLVARIAPYSASGAQFDEDTDLLLLSQDHGESWTEVTTPGSRKWEVNYWEGTPRWVEPIGWDSKGNLFYVWSEGNRLMLGRSDSNGQDWQTHVLTESEQTLYFPFITVTDELIACSWVSGFEEQIKHHAAVVRMTENEPTVAMLEPQKLTDIRSRYAVDTSLSTGGEYFPILRLSDGDFGMVTTIQNYIDDRLGFSWWRLKLD